MRSLRRGPHIKEPVDQVFMTTCYLMNNRGPDSDGRCSPYKAGVIDLSILETALPLAQQSGISHEWRPWHFKGIRDKYTHPSIVSDILCAKVESIIGNEHRNPDKHTEPSEILAAVRGLKSAQLEKRFQVTVDGRTLDFAFSPLFAEVYHSSSYAVALAYLRAIDQEELANSVRPYHMAVLPNGTLTDKGIAEEVLGKKLRVLLDTKYNGDPVALIRATSQEELAKSFEDLVCGIPVTVRTDAFVRSSDGYVDALKEGFRGLGFHVFAEAIRPYHTPTAPQNTYTADSPYPAEIAVKVFDRLLKEKFKGNVFAMLTDFSIEDISSEFNDVIKNPVTGCTVAIPVSPLTMIAHYKGNRWLLAQAYLTATGRTNLQEQLRMYHFSRSIKDYLEEPEVLEDLLTRKMDSLLKKPPYNGDLHKFIREVSYDEINEPLQEKIDGNDVTVSTECLLKKFKYSPLAVVERYLQLTEDQLGASFNSNMRAKRPLFFYHDRATRTHHHDRVRHILFGRLDTLTDHSEMPLEECLDRVTVETIQQPFYVALGSRAMPVTTKTAWRIYSTSGNKATLLNEYTQWKHAKSRDNNPEAALSS